ncbi:MAG: hypothetical protein ACKKL4_00155 [Patescibacteria group bacterium]
MEGIPSIHKKVEKQHPQSALSRKAKIAAILGNTAVIGGISTAISHDLNPAYSYNDSAPYQTQESVEESIKQQERQTSLGYTSDIEPRRQTKIRVEVEKPSSHTPRAEIRPEEWRSMSEFKYPLYLFDFIAKQEAERLGVDSERFIVELDKLLDLFIDIESDWNPQAVNPKSSARGYYQYLTANNSEGKKDSSVHTSINRILDILKRNNIQNANLDNEYLDWAAKLYENPETITDTSIDAQRLMVLADLVQSPGSDEYLRKLVSDDPAQAREAALGLYYEVHHTNPDEKVRANVAKDIDSYYPLPVQKLAVESDE